MHVGFDISQTGTGKAGCGFFAHAMIQAMIDIAPEHKYSLFPSFGDFYFDPSMPIRSPYAGRDVHYGPRHLTRETSGTFWRKPDFGGAIGKPDIVHSNNFWCPAPTEHARLVYTLYDMGFVVDPTWTTEANRVGCFEGVFRSAVAADWVVAISEASRQHYLSIFPAFPEERIRVIYPCSRFSDSDAKGTRPDALNGISAGSFWLTVGTIEPRKNQRRLAEAYLRYLDLGGRPMPLVVAGGKGWLMEDFQQHLAELGIANRVVLTGYVTDEELIWLYGNCFANLYPSLFEGFGLPVLEGMQFGAATLVSNSTSLPEVAGDAALLLAPDDIEVWARSMLRLADDRNELGAMRAAARKQAERFDWKNSARKMLRLYEEAITSPRRPVMRSVAPLLSNSSVGRK